jgi:hypothetical protein
MAGRLAEAMTEVWRRRPVGLRWSITATAAIARHWARIGTGTKRMISVVQGLLRTAVLLRAVSVTLAAVRKQLRTSAVGLWPSEGRRRRRMIVGVLLRHGGMSRIPRTQQSPAGSAVIAQLAIGSTGAPPVEALSRPGNRKIGAAVISTLISILIAAPGACYRELAASAIEP